MWRYRDLALWVLAYCAAGVVLNISGEVVRGWDVFGLAPSYSPLFKRIYEVVTERGALWNSTYQITFPALALVAHGVTTDLKAAARGGAPKAMDFRAAAGVAAVAILPGLTPSERLAALASGALLRFFQLRLSIF